MRKFLRRAYLQGSRHLVLLRPSGDHGYAPRHLSRLISTVDLLQCTVPPDHDPAPDQLLNEPLVAPQASTLTCVDTTPITKVDPSAGGYGDQVIADFGLRKCD